MRPARVGPSWAHDPDGTIFETEASDISPSTCAPLLLKGPERDKVLTSQRARPGQLRPGRRHGG